MKYQDFENKFLEVSKQFVEIFDIDDENRDAIKIILKYFARIEQKNYPLSKGLLIKGCIGSGKTLVFKIAQKMGIRIAINNMRDIVSEFNIGGFEAINDYATTKYRMIDDLGVEYNGKFYGHDTNVGEELIIRRYEQFQKTGLLTHFTTNLGTGVQIKGRYGERAHDRLKEMCSGLILGDNHISRRDKYNPIDKTPKPEPEISKEESDKLELDATHKMIEQIYNGEEIFNSMYVIAYDYLKANKKIELTKEHRKDITKRAEKMLLSERENEINKKMTSGNLSEARNLSKKIFDISSSIIVYQKKIAVKEFLEGKKQLDIPLNEII